MWISRVNENPQKKVSEKKKGSSSEGSEGTKQLASPPKKVTNLVTFKENKG